MMKKERVDVKSMYVYRHNIPNEHNNDIMYTKFIRK